jgi:hypothetical protein
MSLALQTAAFMLGVVLSIGMIAALHGAVDLWYDIRKYCLRVICTIVAWETIILACMWVLDLPYQSALVRGLWIFLLFYLSILPLAGWFMNRTRSDLQREAS